MKAGASLARPLGLTITAPAAVAALFVITRLVALAGMLSAVGGDLGAALRGAASSWDSNWYQIIVTGGYANSGPALPKAGFYPGYPMLTALFYEPMRAIATWLPTGYVPSPPIVSAPFGQDPLLVAALLIASNLSLVVAVAALWRLYEPELGPRATLIGCGLLLAGPSAFFLSSAFSESTFIAATALAFLFAQRGRWELAGLAGAAACLTRQPGVWLVPTLGIVWLQSPPPRSFRSAAIGLAALAAGAAAFPLYCLVALGDALLYVHLQASHWGHRLTNPFASYWLLLQRMRTGLLGELRVRPLPPAPASFPGPRTYVLDGFALLGATASAALGWLRLPIAHVIWIVLMFAFPLATGGNQYSMNRYVLSAWPAFFFFGWLLRRVPGLAAAIMVAGLAAMFLFAHDHVLGRTFVG